MSFLIYGVLLFLRFKAPCLLLITVLKNRVGAYKFHYVVRHESEQGQSQLSFVHAPVQVNEHCQVLRLWYWLSLLLDILLVAFRIGLSVAMVLSGRNGKMAELLELTILLLPFILFRALFWAFARSMVLELSYRENSLFPVRGCTGVFRYLGTHIESLVKVLLAWEVVSPLDLNLELGSGADSDTTISSFQLWDSLLFLCFFAMGAEAWAQGQGRLGNAYFPGR